MSATNAQIIQKAITQYKKDIETALGKRCCRFCDELRDEAIRNRDVGDGGVPHNYTGNLLNSIVVCAYKNGNPFYASYSAGRVRKALYFKMTSPKKYFFIKDYDGAASRYKAEVATDEGLGEDNARRFFASYKPAGKHLFTIVVAYTAEYADWVHMKRQTVGIMRTYDYAERYGVEWLRVPQTGGSYFGSPYY